MQTYRLPLLLFAIVGFCCRVAVASEETPPGDGGDGSTGKSEATETPRFIEGLHYFKLPVPVETRDRAKIEVVEVFSYNCPHCYYLEPALGTWLAVQFDDVDFYRLPLATPNLQTLAQGFYTAKALDVFPRCT